MSRAIATIKVRPETHARLLEIAQEDDKTMGELITYLIDRYERERFWQGVAEDLEKFKKDTNEFSLYREEFTEWDRQTTEALESEPPYYEEDEE